MNLPSEAMSNGSPKPEIGERYLRVLLCLVAGYVITMYNEERSFYEAILTKPYIYLRAILASFLIALAMTSVIAMVSRKLDKRLDWHHHLLQRLIWQISLGFILPAIGAFLLAAGFFALYGRNILRTTYLKQDYTLILMMLVVFNLYVFATDLYRRLKPVRNLEGEARTAPNPAPQATPASFKEVLMVDTLTKSIPVRVDTISYCYIFQGSVFMHTFDMRSLNDAYQLSMPLKTLEELLDPRKFFRINRQMIIQFDACKGIVPNKNKLEVLLEPAPYIAAFGTDADRKKLCIVAEDRVVAFKSWLKR